MLPDGDCRPGKLHLKDSIMKSIKTWILTASLLGVAFMPMGCDKAAEKAKDATKAVENLKGEALDKAKDSLIKPITEKFAAIEEKIKALTGADKTDAEGMLAKLKDKVTGLKDISGDKFGEYKDAIMKMFEELKKKVGM
jgi:hypothetical protein